MKNLPKLLEKIVHDGYADIASQFAETRQRGAAPKLDPLLKVLPTQGKVLDVGCGSGRLVKFLPSGLDYLGVDPCVELLVIAQKQYPQFQFKQGDFRNLKIFGQFDAVVSVAAFHHLPDQSSRLEALREMKRVTQKNGLIVFSVWNFWGTSKRRYQLWKNFWRPTKIDGMKLPWNDLVFPWKNRAGNQVSQRYYHAFSKRELYHLLRLVGASKKDYQLVSDRHNYWVIWRPQV